MSPADLKKRIEALGPETIVQVTDLTGTEDHYEVMVVSGQFEGKNLIEQHRMVNELLKEQLQSGEVHALSLKTLTPELYEQQKKKNIKPI